MNTIKNAITIPIGLKGSEGGIHLSQFSSEMLAFSIEGRAERSPTILLTVEQARELKEALEGLIEPNENSQHDAAA